LSRYEKSFLIHRIKNEILGSGASNQWTVVFDGDVNLSAIMSFVSTTASFIMMPIYFYTFGKLYMDDLSIRVPFWGLARTLGLVVVPYTVGILISHFVPKSRPFVEKLIKPMMIMLMLFFLTFGLVVNWYLLSMIDLTTALTAPLLPFIGFIFGALLAWMCRLNWKHIKTIGIEAGIQNVGIAFMIILYSFPQPYATQALIVPMVVAFLTTKPFWVILIIRNQLRKYKKRKELAKKSNLDGKLIITNDKPSLNNGKDHMAEHMQQL
jgi:predicted Na+-dependent transporter